MASLEGPQSTCWHLERQKKNKKSLLQAAQSWEIRGTWEGYYTLPRLSKRP